MNLPESFILRMKEMLGNDYDDFIKSYDLPNKQGLRINPLKNHTISETMQPIPWAKYGYYYNDDLKPGKSPLHDLGLYYIQEPSAMSAVSVLSPNPDEIVLDLCASPGGKSTQIASLMENSGLLISNEIISKRATILADNIARLGFTNTVVLNETPENISKYFNGFFDKVLVDAPCSGEGMFRKNPEAINEWSEENVQMCAERQLDILNTIKNVLKENGILVYSTCTFSAEENEQVIEKFIQENPEFTLLDTDHTYFSSGFVKNTKTGFKDIEKTIRILPHITSGEGHFVAKLIKTSTEENFVKTLKSNTNKKTFTIIDAFLRQNDIVLPQGIMLNFNNHIYLTPEKTPSLDKLKIQMAGLYLGEIDKNNNFIPSHNFALALKPVSSLSDKNPYNQPITTKTISLTEREFLDYISGLTLNTDLDINGWVLLIHNGNPIGWGKVSNGQIKNHYPKYLRKSYY